MASSPSPSSSSSFFPAPRMMMSLAAMALMAAMASTAEAYFIATEWRMAHATFYGDDSASSTMGGACGYGDTVSAGYGTNTAALSSVLFDDGYGCGQCYQIRCSGAAACYAGSPIVMVTATNLCPPQLGNAIRQRRLVQPAARPLRHVQAGVRADSGLARRHRPRHVSPVSPDRSLDVYIYIEREREETKIKHKMQQFFCRVGCGRSGGVRFQLQGNAYWLLVYVTNVGGGGDVGAMWVKGDGSPDWICMSHNWGASYQAFSQLGGRALSFKLVSYTTRETLLAFDVAPASWTTGLT